MTGQQKLDYLETLPLVNALFWFIENVTEEDPDRTELFFHLRERVRSHNRETN